MSRPPGLPPAIALLLLLFPCDGILGQAPREAYLYPSQVTVGATVEAELLGKHAGDIERLYVSRPGIEARLVGKGKVLLTAVLDAPMGDGDVWALSSSGLAGPARLAVAGLPTRSETEPNSTPAQAQDLDLPAAVFGKVDPGTDGDWYRVRLKAGDGLTAACRSATLGGTLQPTLVVVDPLGHEIAHDTLAQPEPTVHIAAAKEGTYTIGVQDRSYRSTPSPFYQLSLTTGPWIVGAYPPAVPKGKSQTVTLYGYRLPSSEPCTGQGALRRKTVEIEAPQDAPATQRGWLLNRSLFIDSWEFRHPDAGGSVRWELLDRPTADAAAETSGKGPAAAIRRDLPFDVVHRFASSRESVHWYRFPAQSGQTCWLEAVSERIDRACDLELIVHDSAGKPLATIGNSTTPKELGSRLSLDSRDPAGEWKAPADGEYLLAVRDLLYSSSPLVERAYRLSARPQWEDVRVVAHLDDSAAASGWTVKAGGSLLISLTAVRRGGHEGPIEVRAEASPSGVTIPSVTIAARQANGVLQITAGRDAGPWIGPIRLLATTEANRAPLTTEVRTMSPGGPGGPVVSRFCDEMVVAVVPPAG